MLKQSQGTFNQENMTESHIGASQYNTVIGLDGVVSKKKLVYLDSTATALTDTKIHDEIEQFLKESYANTHTTGHHRGRDSTEAVSSARKKVGQFVGYDAERDLVIFNGSGATGPLNYLAQVMFPKPLRLLNNKKITSDTRKNILNLLSEDHQRLAKEMAAKPIVITTEMDHHSNQLPWFDAEHVKVVPVDKKTGELDLNVLKYLLDTYKNKVRLVTVPGASNVTGIRNPIYEIAKMAHEAGAEMCVDAAQLAPHYKLQKRRSDSNENLDYIILAPHKFGVPNTPGVLVANRSLLAGRRQQVHLGGGIVNTVTVTPPKFTPINELDLGEEPGTPNIPGIIAVGLAAAKLEKHMPELVAHENKLTHRLMHKLEALGDDVNIIGSKDPTKRVGVVSVTVKGVHHAVATAYLNDTWNIAVRNGCFCAHPYIIKLSDVTDHELTKLQNGDRSNLPGYVRISFGEHNTEQDVDTIVQALGELVQNKSKVIGLYGINKEGDAVRLDRFKQPKGWSFDLAVKRNNETEKPSLSIVKDQSSSHAASVLKRRLNQEQEQSL